MKILQNLAPMPMRRRMLSAVTSLLGLLLTLAGLITAAPVILMVVAILLALLKGSFPSNTGTGAWMFFIACATVSAICLYFGQRLVRGKRRLVLFLRRFGFHSASRALTFAVSSAFGRRWRLVTLDDAQIASVGVPGGKRRMVQIGRWLFTIILSTVVLYVVLWFIGDEPGRIVTDIFDNIFNSARNRGDNALAAILGAFIGTIAVGLFILAFAFAFMLLWVSLAASATIFTWSTWRQVRKAEGSKALVLTDKHRIESTLTHVVKRAKRIFAPRLTVLRVAGAFWQQVVHKLAMSADAIVIDISEPSKNLLWEIETLKRIKEVRCVYVGQSGLVLELMKLKEEHRQQDDVDRCLGNLLEDDEVLVYNNEPGKAMRAFAADLAAYLESPKSI